MTREQINKYIRLVPGHTKQAYGIAELPDLSAVPYKDISFGGKIYKYFPTIPGVLVDEKLVRWETEKDDLQEVNVYDQSHMKEIVKRGRSLQGDDIVGVFSIRKDGYVYLRPMHQDQVAKTHIGRITVDDTFIYYDPTDADLENNGPLKMAAKAIFLLQRYGQEYMIPYKGMMPGDWGSYE